MWLPPGNLLQLQSPWGEVSKAPRAPCASASMVPSMAHCLVFTSPHWTVSLSGVGTKAGVPTTWAHTHDQQLPQWSKVCNSISLEPQIGHHEEERPKDDATSILSILCSTILVSSIMCVCVCVWCVCMTVDYSCSFFYYHTLYSKQFITLPHRGQKALP